MNSRKLLFAGLVLLLGSFVLGGSAEADKTVKLSSGAPLRARPGERAPTITKLSAGQSVKIVAEKGRWLQVSVGGRVGWITRTQAELDEETEIVSKGRKGERVPGGKRDKSKAWDALDEGAVGGDVVAATEEEEAVVADEEEEAPPKKAKKLTKKEKRALAKAEKAERAREEREARLAAEQEKKEAAAAEAEAPAFSEGQLVVVKRDTSVHKKPSKKSPELYEATKGDKATVLLVDEDGAWVRIEDEEGTKGWVAAADLGTGKAKKAAKKVEPEVEEEPAVAAVEEEEEEAPLPAKKAKKAKVVEADNDDDDDDAREIAGKDVDVPGIEKKRQRLTWSVGAGFGFLSRTQRFTSGGTGVRANYGINNSAPAVQAAGQAIYRFGPVGVGVEASYVRSLGGSGIAVDDGSGNMGTLDYRSVAIDARLLAGYDLSGFLIHGRAGYHRDSTYVSFDDFAMLPDERVAGLTVGGGIAAPHITRRLGAHAEFDMLLAGKLTQDVGARDGTETKSAAFYIGGGASFQILKGLEASASYGFTMAGYGFAGPSDRDASAIDGRRKDRQHLVTVGAKYAY